MPRLATAALLGGLLLLGLPCQLAATSISEDIDRATRTLESGDIKEAEILLERLERLAPRDRQVRFLKAHLAIKRGRKDRAIALFRDLLSEDPSLIRVRLDLAKALYETGAYDASLYHFELALGSDLPSEVRRNVQRYVDALRHTETYLNVAVFVASDSNANQGPRASTIYIFGLPFTVATGAEPKRATGLALNASGRLALGGDHRTYLTAYIEDREYGVRDFNYRLGQVGIGRTRPFEWGRIGAEGGYYDSSFREKPLSEGPWTRLYAATRAGQRLSLSPSVEWRTNHYPNYQFLYGHQTIVAIDAAFAATPTSMLTAGVSAARNYASDASWSYDRLDLRAGVRKEFSYGFIVDGKCAVGRARYNAEDPLFEKRRRDRQISLELQIANRYWSFFGFAPTLFISRTRNESNIELYSWDRDVVGFGATTRF